MKKLLLIILFSFSCEDINTALETTLSGTYTLTDYQMYANAGCSGESIIDSAVAALTLTQLEYKYSFDENSVTIVQITNDVEELNENCDYLIVDDILTPSCFPVPHTLNSNHTQFFWELGADDITVDGYDTPISVCYRYIFSK